MARATSDGVEKRRHGSVEAAVPAATLIFPSKGRPLTCGRMIKDRPKRLELLYIPCPQYFVTFCSRNRKTIPSLKSAQVALENHGRHGLEKHKISLSHYMIMPDHVHLFVRGGFEFSVSRWIGGLKRFMSQAMNAPKDFWQPGFFDRVMRTHDNPEVSWLYVTQNPVRAGLVRQSEDWPYQGRIVDGEKSAADTAAATERGM
jgi:putative transposase